ncbi:MAG TPA: hypothetical protein VGR97_08185 [Candidatus Acidoferrales bacterium]|nr:hypothetical protein [Candidatus Acidoferrales bacterium]
MSRGEFKKFLTVQLRDPKTNKKQLVAFAKLYHEIGMCKGKPRGKSGKKLRARHDESETESTELFELVRDIEKEQAAAKPQSSPTNSGQEENKKHQPAREESEQEHQVTKGREALVLAGILDHTASKPRGNPLVRNVPPHLVADFDFN